MPILLVIVVAVALVASVVTLIDSIDMTVLTMYGYQRHFSVISPRNALVLPDDIIEQIKHNPLSQHTYPTLPAFTMVKTIFGKMPFVIFGVSPDARDILMTRCGLKLASGHLPDEGKPEVIMHADIARNLHLKIGDIVLEPRSEDSYSAVPARLSGTFEGPVWLALTSKQFIHENFPVAVEGLMDLAPTESQQRLLDIEVDKGLDKSRSRLWSYRGLVRDTKDALSSLYLIMNIVIAIIIFAIAFLTGMLANIYFMQRIPEFATLSAIGYQRNNLLRRVLSETAILCFFGWLLGSVLTILVLMGLKAWIMQPRGLLLDPFDFAVYRYTIPLPLTIAAFAIVPMWRRLKTLDPVSIIERRQ